jgi:hypothetical protein
MFYALSLGQHQLAEDDKAGLFSNYPITDGTKKSISGTVVGSRNFTPIFGAQVQAISVKTGTVAAAAVTDASGAFTIERLPINDQYFLYTRSLSLTGLPSNYVNLKNDFCESSTSYRGSFFQSCGASNEGYPQAVSLTSGNVNVGLITIRCGLDVPPDYIQKKGATSSFYSLPANRTLDGTNVSSYIGNSFVGYFSVQELNQTTIIPDQIRVNLSSIGTSEWNATSANPLYLEVKILNQIFYSPYKVDVIIKRPNTSNYVYPSPAASSDGFLNLDVIGRIPIDRSILSENDFTIQITPQKNIANIYSYFPGFSTTPSPNNFQDKLFFYLTSVTLVSSADGGNTFSQVSSKLYSITDNTQCPDAMNTYALTSFNSRGVASTENRSKKALACGSIDTGNNNKNGPMGFLIGLILCFAFSNARSRFKKRL